MKVVGDRCGSGGCVSEEVRENGRGRWAGVVEKGGQARRDGGLENEGSVDGNEGPVEGREQSSTVWRHVTVDLGVAPYGLRHLRRSSQILLVLRIFLQAAPQRERGQDGQSHGGVRSVVVELMTKIQ